MSEKFEQDKQWRLSNKWNWTKDTSFVDDMAEKVGKALSDKIKSDSTEIEKTEESTPSAKTGKDVSSSGAESDKDLYIKSCKEAGISEEACEEAWKAKQKGTDGSGKTPEKKDPADAQTFESGDYKKLSKKDFAELSEYIKRKKAEEVKETIQLKNDFKKIYGEKCDFVESGTYNELKFLRRGLELLPKPKDPEVKEEKTDESDIPSETEIYKVLPKDDYANKLEAGKQDRLKTKWNWNKKKED